MTETRLRTARLQRGMSLRKLAKAAGVDPGQLSRVERGKQKPSPALVLKVARVLDLEELTRTIELIWPSDAGEGASE